MHILANFVIFDDFRPFLIEKWTFWTTFEDLEQPPVQKSRYICLQPQGPSQDLLKTLLFWPNFASFWTPFEGPGRRLRLGPVQAAFGLEDPLRASQTHARNLKFWLF